ncbi:ABC transporter ATP-binding protein [Candidatus Dependentiae bacterium]|nr:ABC transporter ATP-binding protein [Candidatus Dependentiae bacterium]
MFSRFRHLPEKYYAFWIQLINLKNKVSILPIDFKKSWLDVIWRQKKLLTVSFIFQCIIQAFYTLYPVFLGGIIERQQFHLFIFFMFAWLGVIFLEFISNYFSGRVEIQSINSIQYNAFRFFLTVDPLFHTMKSSGKLFAKIERGARSYEDFLDIILWDILPIFVSVTTVIVSFLYVDIKLGSIGIILLLLIAAINIFFSLFTSSTFEQKLIDADDLVKIISVESLTQVQLIRSSFASNEILDRANNANSQMMYKEGTAWIAFSASITISKIAYLISIFILGSIILSLISRGLLSIVEGTSLLFMYTNGTYEIIGIGRSLRKLIKATTRIKDLYSFVKIFGKRSFPVLPDEREGAVTISKVDTITIDLHDLYFSYNPKAKIFENHGLHLSIPTSHPNKLYGIIGPSGSGKTTILSILGGQLKPEQGSVIINGIPIYEVDDKVRRRLVALQGQIASSLSGTVKDNLLLGLPKGEVIYNDEQIIDVLEEVGIWNIFDEKEGLETPIGEGGLNISGGQRQRLNFAALYLRARYYEPSVILIDEPTSSLDEVSEQAITTMIGHLAEKAVTFVIAHRLKTIRNAVGILDFSLIQKDKNLVFYSEKDLEEKSAYFTKLMSGDLQLED